MLFLHARTYEDERMKMKMLANFIVLALRCYSWPLLVSAVPNVLRMFAREASTLCQASTHCVLHACWKALRGLIALVMCSWLEFWEFQPQREPRH